MKNKVIYIVASLLLLTVGFTSCEKKSKDLTSITCYAELFLEGDEVMSLNINGTYVEPGYTAVMNGEDVTDKVKVSTNLDPTKKGVYTVNYVIVNPDGFAATASRLVVVYDLSDPYEGLWWVDPASYRVAGSGAPVLFGGPFYTLIWNNGDGTYDIDDLLGGWYDQRAGYGSECAMQANVTFALDGTMTLNDSFVPYWEDSADLLDGSSYDPVTKALSYHLQYASSYNFYITLHKADN